MSDEQRERWAHACELAKVDFDAMHRNDPSLFVALHDCAKWLRAAPAPSEPAGQTFEDWWRSSRGIFRKTMREKVRNLIRRWPRLARRRYTKTPRSDESYRWLRETA